VRAESTRSGPARIRRVAPRGVAAVGTGTGVFNPSVGRVVVYRDMEGEMWDRRVPSATELRDLAAALVQMLRPAGRAAQPGRVAAAGGVPAGPPANQRAPGSTVDRWRTSRDPRPYPLPRACGFPSLAWSLAIGHQRRRGRRETTATDAPTRFVAYSPVRPACHHAPVHRNLSPPDQCSPAILAYGRFPGDGQPGLRKDDARR